MGGGGRSSRVTYKQPEPDRSFEKYLEYQMKQDTARQNRLDQEKADERARVDRRRSTATANLGGYYGNLESQLQSGLISYADAQSQLSGYSGRFDLDPGAISTYQNQLTDTYTTNIRPQRQGQGAEYAYSEILGRAGTAEELERARKGFSSGYFTTVEDFKNSLYNSDEYKDKRNQSYLDNYYDTQYGKQLKDKDGKLTGQRTFKFNEAYMPTFKGDLAGDAGIDLPTFGDMTGTVAELEENTQSMRDARKFLYSAGLTNLQGNIDKELSKIRIEGTKDITRISKEGDIYGNLVSAFNFSA